ncbi:MAG: STAS domain-containing protein [Luminiphilus sp.]|nr:STAS domain-containing protein [Luminiphilus sp.]
MKDCQIRAGSNDGAHVLKLQGDVRLVMCTALDEYFERMFAEPDFLSVWVDVTEATGLDSTTLGMLAKLAISTEARFGFKPAIFSCDPSIDRLLQAMGFSQLFDVRSERCDVECFRDLPARNASEDEVRHKVIEAHRTLMGLNEANHAAFQSLVMTLEAQ